MSVLSFPANARAGRRGGLRLALGAGAFGLGLLVCHGGPASAGPASLDIKPGLWKVTTTSHMNGQLPIPEADLARMPPAQRAKFEAAMKAAAANMGAPHVFEECLTAKQIADGLKLNKTQPSCHRTVLSSSPTELHIHERCTGATVREMDGTFEAPDPSSMHGTIHVVATHGARTMNVNSVVQGQRLGADCGGLPPGKIRNE